MRGERATLGKVPAGRAARAEDQGRLYRRHRKRRSDRLRDPGLRRRLRAVLCPLSRAGPGMGLWQVLRGRQVSPSPTACPPAASAPRAGARRSHEPTRHVLEPQHALRAARRGDAVAGRTRRAGLDGGAGRADRRAWLRRLVGAAGDAEGPVRAGRQAPGVAADVGAIGTADERRGHHRRPPRLAPPSSEALDRLYRPQALDVPVLVARDGPISTLDPHRARRRRSRRSRDRNWRDRPRRRRGAGAAGRPGAAGRRGRCRRSGDVRGAPVLGAGPGRRRHGAVREDPRCRRNLCPAEDRGAAAAAGRQCRLGLFRGERRRTTARPARAPRWSRTSRCRSTS